jgi:hypothetical protein
MVSVIDYFQQSRGQNNLFAQTRRYAQNFILGISTMPVVNFFACLDLNENLRFAKGSTVKDKPSKPSGKHPPVAKKEGANPWLE